MGTFKATIIQRNIHPPPLIVCGCYPGWAALVTCGGQCRPQRCANPRGSGTLQLRTGLLVRGLQLPRLAAERGGRVLDEVQVRLKRLLDRHRDALMLTLPCPKV